MRRPLSPCAPHRATRKKQQMFEHINIVAPLIGHAEKECVQVVGFFFYLKKYVILFTGLYGNMVE